MGGMITQNIVLKDGAVLENAVIPKDVKVIVVGKDVTIRGCTFEH